MDKSQLTAIDYGAIDAVGPSGTQSAALGVDSPSTGSGEPAAAATGKGVCDRRRRFSDFSGFVLVGVFIVLIFAPLIKMMTSERILFSSAEKRRLAEPPDIKLDWKNAKKFIPEYEAYYNDHFGYRERYIRSYNRILHKYFNKSPVPDVLYGKEGWLFLTTNKVIEDYMGFNPFTPDELKVIEEYARSKQKWLAARGIQYLFIVVPGKQTVYPEYLPDYIYSRRGQTRLDQLTLHLQLQPDLNFLDLRPALLTAKNRDRIYHLTDSHWNLRGAQAGYQEIMAKLQQMFPRRDLAARNYHESGTRLEKGGDLAVMIKKEETMREVAPILDMASNCSKLNELKIGAWDTSGMLEKAFYTECPAGQLTAIIFRDSFTSLLVPFLAEHFKKAVFLWKYYDQEIMEELLTIFKPDIVIEEMGERRLFRDATGKAGLD